MVQGSEALSVICDRLARAEEHRNAIQRDFRRVQEEHTIIRAEPNAEKTLLDLFLHLPVQTWFLDFSEALHQMRSALDNMVYALHVTHSGAPHPGKARKVAFPIYVDPLEFKGRGERAIKGLHPDAKALVRRTQPYNRRNRPEFHELAVLSELNNRDKHRVPHFTLIDFMGVDFRVDPPDFPVIAIDVTTQIPVDGAHIVRIHFGRPLTDDVKMKFNVPGAVGVDYSWLVGNGPSAVDHTTRTPLDSTLVHIHRRVCRVVDALSRDLSSGHRCTTCKERSQ